MKLTDNTLAILKNFANINESIIIAKGTKQRTIDRDDAIMAEAEVDFDFPRNFGIYDLRNFLMNVSALGNPEVTFHENHMEINDGNIRLNYYYSAQNLIYSPPDAELAIDKPDVEFELSNSNFQRLIRVSDLNGLQILGVVGKDGEILLQSVEEKQDSSTTATMKIAEYSGTEFKISFKIANLKLIPQDYTVKINLDGFALFENKDKTLRYFVALEK